MEPEFIPCPTCRQITLAEVPPCADEHGANCPDRACTVCGTALTFAGHLIWGDLLAASRATFTPRSRDAA